MKLYNIFCFNYKEFLFSIGQEFSYASIINYFDNLDGGILFGVQGDYFIFSLEEHLMNDDKCLYIKNIYETYYLYYKESVYQFVLKNSKFSIGIIKSDNRLCDVLQGSLPNNHYFTNDILELHYQYVREDNLNIILNIN